MLNLSAHQLRQAAALKEQIESLQTQLDQILGGAPAGRPQAAARATAKGRYISAAGRARIAAAAKARWAKFRKEKGGAPARPSSQPKRKMSPAARRRLAEIARARWAKAKRSGKTRL